MLRRKSYILLVCLVFSVSIFVTGAAAYSIRQAAGEPKEDLIAPPTPGPKDRAALKTGKIQKVRPIYKVQPEFIPMDPRLMECYLPVFRTRSWEAEAQVIFARVKGKVRLPASYWGSWGWGVSPDQDLNADWGIPDHSAVGSFSLRYRFRPNWSLRYAIMPMELNGSGGGQNIWYGYGQANQVKWQRLYQRAGLVYDPVSTYRARVSIFADYVRLDEKISLACPTGGWYGCGTTFDHQLNMGMAGLEFERCLKTARFCDTLSLECRAGIAFLDEAFGSDIMTGLKYTIPMGHGRWGYLGGGYRFVTFKKGYNDFKQIDTALEGGYLKAGIVF